MKFDMWHDDLLKAAREALTRPSDFGYFGDLPLFESWGLTFGQNRDSDVLERSNYRRLLSDAQEVATSEDGDNAEDVSEYIQSTHMSHWLCGWIDQVAVRVLIDPDKGIEVGNITNTFKFVAQACLRLRDEYPVYDESDHSELESEECEAAFTTEWNGIDWSELVPDGDWDDDIRWCVYQGLTESETPDGFDSDEITDLYLAAVEWQAHRLDVGLDSPGQLALWDSNTGFRGCLTCGNEYQH